MKKFECNIDQPSAKFNSNLDLRQNKQFKHKDRQTSARKICSEKTQGQSDLWMYMRKRPRNGFPYSCLFCPADYKVGEELRLHIKERHPNGIPLSQNTDNPVSVLSETDVSENVNIYIDTQKPVSDEIVIPVCGDGGTPVVPGNDDIPASDNIATPASDKFVSENIDYLRQHKKLKHQDKQTSSCKIHVCSENINCTN